VLRGIVADDREFPGPKPAVERSIAPLRRVALVPAALVAARLCPGLGELPGADQPGELAHLGPGLGEADWTRRLRAVFLGLGPERVRRRREQRRRERGPDDGGAPHDPDETKRSNSSTSVRLPIA